MIFSWIVTTQFRRCDRLVMLAMLCLCWDYGISKPAIIVNAWSPSVHHLYHSYVASRTTTQWMLSSESHRNQGRVASTTTSLIGASTVSSTSRRMLKTMGESSTCTTSSRTTATTTTTTRLYGILDFFTNPYDSKIPSEWSEEIYRAEANTKAAQYRKVRIVVYTIFALLGIGMAVFNGLLTEIRANDGGGVGVGELQQQQEEIIRMALSSSSSSSSTDFPDLIGKHHPYEILVQAGFGWVVENPVYRFLFTNKIGGAMAFLLGGGSALLAEAELDSQRINAERIYEELMRRRKKRDKKIMNIQSRSSKKLKKNKKSLRALSEVIQVVDAPDTNTDALPSSRDSISLTNETKEEENEELNVDDTTNTATGSKDRGVLGTLQDWYGQADSMAASQALLLNKKLEDAGVVEKITDETGLKVIGRDEVKKRQDTTKQ